jgi:hypothetical protein
MKMKQRKKMSETNYSPYKTSMTRDVFEEQVAKIESKFGCSFQISERAFAANTVGDNGRALYVSWNTHDDYVVVIRKANEVVTSNGETLVEAFNGINAMREINAIVSTSGLTRSL